VITKHQKSWFPEEFLNVFWSSELMMSEKRTKTLLSWSKKSMVKAWFQKKNVFYSSCFKWMFVINRILCVQTKHENVSHLENKRKAAINIKSDSNRKMKLINLRTIKFYDSWGPPQKHNQPDTWNVRYKGD
jgi:hypothetical protein